MSDLEKWREDKRLKVAGLSDAEMADELEGIVYSCIGAAESEFCTGDTDEYDKARGVVFEVARRLRAEGHKR